MKITIFEYASGGGFQGEEIPADILCEGYSMLKAVSEDFKAAGYTVETLLDSRLKRLKVHLGVEALEVSSPSMLQPTLRTSLESSDVSMMIAPETGGILSSLVASAEELGARPLNATPEAIGRASDKLNLASTLKSRGLRTPDTVHLNVRDGAEAAEKALRALSGRIVLKPLDGVGCEGLSLVVGAQEIPEALNKILKASRTGDYLAQRLIEGVSASVSLIANGSRATPLSLNRQHVLLAQPTGTSRYLGGSVPLRHPYSKAALEVAKRAVELFPGLKGYIGVDLVLSPEGPALIELNPRVTVSYTGLRLISGTNLAEAVCESVLKGVLPKPPSLKGFSSFSKVPVKHLDLEGIHGGVDVLFPPMELEWGGAGYTFFAVRGGSEDEAERMLRGVVKV